MKRGFTLVEMLVVLVIVAVLAVIGLNSMSTWAEGRKVRTTAETIRDALVGARTEAIRRNRTVHAYITGNTFATEVPAFDGEAAIALQRTQLQAPVAVQASGTSGDLSFSSDGRTSPPGASFNFVTTGPTDACKSAGGPLECFTVQVSSAGSVRICDPSAPALDASGTRNAEACR